MLPMIEELNISRTKQKLICHLDEIASMRDRYIQKNRYYYEDLLKFFTYNIPDTSSVLEIGCGTGYLLNAINPDRGVGIDLSPNMINAAKRRYPHLEFYQMDAEFLNLQDVFDVVIISDTLGELFLIQSAQTPIYLLIFEESQIRHEFVF